MKLNYILISGFLIIALLVGVVGYVSLNQSQRALQETIGKNSVLLAKETIDKVDRNIFLRAEQIKVYFDDLILETIIAMSNQKFDTMENAQQYIEEKDKEWIVAGKDITPFMKEIFDRPLSKGLNTLIKAQEKEYGYKVFGEIFVTNRYGINIAQSSKTSDYYQADEEWWQKAKADELYISDIEYDESAGIYSLDIGIRIDDEEGNFLGVIKAVLNIEEVIDILKELEEEEEEEEEEEVETREFKLLTKDGKIIHSTEEFEFFENISEKLFSKFDILAGEQMFGYFTAQGDKAGEEDELFAYAHSKGYKGFNGLGWILVIEHETEEIFTPIVKIRNIILTISLIVIILAMIIGFFVSKSISKPIKKLTDNVDEISKGKFDVKLEESKIDEIKNLTKSLNRILASMKLAILRAGVKKEDIGIGTKEALAAKKKAEKQAEKRTKELERFAKLAEGRELMMIELKKKVKELEKKVKK